MRMEREIQVSVFRFKFYYFSVISMVSNFIHSIIWLNLTSSVFFFFFQFLGFFWPCPQYVDVSQSGIEPMPPRLPRPLQ